MGIPSGVRDVLRKAHHERRRRMAGDVASEVERAERRVGARGVAHQPPDVGAHLQRVAAADERQVVHELVGLALVDALAAGAVAEPVVSLDADRRESDLELVGGRPFGPPTSMPWMPRSSSTREPGRAPGAEAVEIAAHVAEADLVQHGGAPRGHVLHRQAVVVEEPRRRELRVDRRRRIVAALIEVVAEDLLPRAQDVIDAGDELVLRVFGAREAAEVVGAGLIGQRLILVDHRHRQRIQAVGRDDVVGKRQRRSADPG